MQERNREAGSADSSSPLPARFDWSIMGCTILLLALMNLEEKGEGKGEREREKNTVSITLRSRRFITGKHKDKTVLRDLMATLATESLREAPATKQRQTKGRLCADLGAQREILLMFLMIYSPLF